uniref:Uncharacterized protein n=1 Tax=Cannabis sativa TaxID=3483 RepID=A0A803QCH2_CANSA
MDVDFESMFRGSPRADKKSRKKVTPIGEVVDCIKEPKWLKTKAYTRKSSSQPTTSVVKLLESGNEISAAGNENSATGNGIF